MFDTLKLVFDTFGKDLMVPVMIFIICMIFKAPAKKAFSSAVLVGVGLKGMTFITTEFGAVLSPLVQQLIATTGLNLKALDIGWQAVASVAYSTDIGMMFIGVAVVAIYFVLYVLFRKNKSSVREYIEKIALGDKYVAPVAPEAAANGQ